MAMRFRILGSGSSGSLFGASGSANFLSRTTAVLATVFFVCTLALAYFGNLRPTSSGSVLEGPAAAAPASSVPTPVVPATPASGAALTWPDGWEVWPARTYGDTRLELAERA